MAVSPCLSCGALGTHEKGCSRNAGGKRATNTTRWQRLSRRLRRQVGACELCGTDQSLTVDHLWPVSLRPELEWDEDWLRVLCRSCNSRRGNKLPSDAEIAAQKLLIAARPSKPSKVLRRIRSH